MQLGERIWRCPVCRAGMKKEGNVLACTGERRHCYDVASAGYVNLAPSKACGGGDDAELIRARTSFLDRGYYGRIADAVCDALREHCKGNTVLDAGCGEGYYTLQIAGQGMNALGIDLSKRGILHAAKRARREQASAEFAVAGIFDLPVCDGSVDAVVSLFAPVCEQEFLRVLKPGGILVLVGAGEKHLFSLKRVLYDTPYQNEPRADLPSEMQLLRQVRLTYKAQMENAALLELFSMTPYYYRTSKEGVARLQDTASLDVDVDVEIMVYQK